MEVTEVKHTDIELADIILKKIKKYCTDDEFAFAKRIFSSPKLKSYLILITAIETAYEESKIPFKIRGAENDDAIKAYKAHLDFLKQLKQISDDADDLRKTLSEEEKETIKKVFTGDAENIRENVRKKLE